MAQHLVELCAILVEESFGDTAALIWSHLAEHGRTQFAELLTISGVSSKQLAQTLPILVLNRAIVYYVDPDYDATWYSVSLSGAYNLLRYSRLNDIVKERCGKDAAHVISNMAQLGHVTMKELVNSYGFSKDTTTHTHDDVNGTTKSEAASRDSTPIKTLEQLQEVLMKLIRAGWLTKAHPRLFHTDFDVQQTLEKQVQEDHFPDGKITGPKASKQFNNAVNNLKRKQRDADFVVDGIIGPRDDYAINEMQPHKKQKTNGHMTNGLSHRQLHDDMILSINMRKYLLALRSKSYVRMATTYLGNSSGAVYTAFLQTLERQLHEVSDAQRPLSQLDDNTDDDDFTNPRATAADVYELLAANTDLTTSIKVSNKELPNDSGGKLPKPIEVQEDFSSIGIKQEQDSEEEEVAKLSSFQTRAKLLELIEKHLQSLAEHQYFFCQREGHGRPTVWSVDFAELTNELILAEVDAGITARFGKPATRLVRMLRDKGKLEEKQIAACAFMQMKDVRSILGELYAAGYVEAQELAKDQTRQPAKALYLWYFDTPKVQRMLVHQCYQSMSRLYQRLATERERFKQVISKAQRLTEARFFGDNYYNTKLDGDDDEEDECGNHESYNDTDKPVRFVLGPTGLWKNDSMSNIEKQHIHEWKAIESNFLGQILRLDDLVVLLRDFSSQFNMSSA